MGQESLDNFILQLVYPYSYSHTYTDATEWYLSHLGPKKTRRRKSSTDINGSNFSLVDVKDHFGKGKQLVQVTSEGEDKEQVSSSSLHFSLYSH